jgi:hypothetical protein
LKGNITVRSKPKSSQPSRVHCDLYFFLSLNQKVNTRYELDPKKSATLELLVENEKNEKKRVATEGLMWLLRGLSFTSTALISAQSNQSEELATAFSKSYDLTLKKHHNFVVRGIFGVSHTSLKQHCYLGE